MFNRNQIVEYVWLDKDYELRSKARTIGKDYFLDVELNEYLNRDLNRSKEDRNFTKILQWSYCMLLKE